MEGDREEWWKCSFSPEAEGLWWYHFEYSVPFGKSKIFNVGNGIGALIHEGSEWQLTVYEKDFTTPLSYCGGVIYQIFPDRFCRSGTVKKNVPDDRVIRNDLDGCPDWAPDENGKIKNNDYFGGDIRGIISRLDYLKALGVTLIYLNPIFEAHSNHRYDTADYLKIDPLLGTEKDFSDLCAEADKRGIGIILDGVFSHTGADSRYFNKYGRYDDVGAYQSEKSPYYSWYKFKEWPDKYDCWWNIDILPNVNEDDPRYLRFITGKNGVIRHWLKLGACGWRLDVADELPDEFIDELRKAAKEEKSDCLIIGEVWEDASNKSSYSKRRRYLTGKQLDSVMNYPFKDAILYFLRTGIADGFTDKILTIIENYPPQVLHLLMNHIGTHDTARAMTALAGDSANGRDREWQAGRRLSSSQREVGVKLMKTASAVQFTLPGIPSVYYGDEAGAEGYGDPFNRCFYPYGNENEELLEWYKTLGKIRKENPALALGDFVPVSEAAGCVAYSRNLNGNSILTIANRNVHPITYYLPEDWFDAELLTDNEGLERESVEVPALHAVILRKQR